MNRGEEAFRETAEKLRNNVPVLHDLEQRDELVITVPEATADWKKNELITSALTKVKTSTQSVFSEILFNLDLGVNDPELSLVLQVVDDSNFKGRRAANILSKDLKYIGVSHASKGKKSFCVYVVFAK